jgi:hypothetical protein
MGWMQPASFSFPHGLDATSPLFLSTWAGCNQPAFPFPMGWMQPARFSFPHGLDATSPFTLVWMQPAHFNLGVCFVV